jgi:hypothetical protein
MFHHPFNNGDFIFSKAKNKKNFDYQFIDYFNQFTFGKKKLGFLPLANREGLPKVGGNA